MPEDTAVPQDLVDAFVQTFDQPVETPAVEEPVIEQAEATPVETAPETPGTTEANPEDSYRGFDPLILDALPPEIRAAVESERKSIQGEATRKFQEASELRKQFGDIDPELAKNAVTYMERLADPDFLVEAHAAMTAELVRQGLTQSQAEVTATQTIEQEQTNALDDDEFEFDGAANPQIMSELNALKAKIAASEARQAEQDQANEYARLEAKVAHDETLLRKDNPEWSDADITDAIVMAHASKGSLLDAGAKIRAIEQRAVARYVAQKTAIPSTISPPPSGSGGVTQDAPKGFGTDLNAAHEAAKEKLRNILAND